MSLVKTQFLSLFTKSITTVLGVVQSIIIIRVLTDGEFGLVGLVVSIGSLIGVFQHLGIVDGAIREIAVLKDKQQIGKLFWVANTIRQAITLPVSLILILAASFIATTIYHRPEITIYIQLFAVILILQGLQDVLGATLTGIKAFVELYVVQIITATFNIIAFGYLVWRFNIAGFFWAMIVTTSLMVVLLSIVLWRHLQGSLLLPRLADVKHYAGKIMGVGVFMYISRLLFVFWNRMPILVLGSVLTAQELGYLNISLSFGVRLTIVAMALSEVNLSWMSSLFVRNYNEFRQTAERNMQRLFLLMLLITLPLNFFTTEIISFINPTYHPAESLIILMTTALFLYTLIDIGTNSIFVAANKSKLRMLIHGLMTTITGLPIIWFLLSEPHTVWATTAVLGGSLLAYGATVVTAKKLFNIILLPGELFIFLIAFFASIPWLLTQPSLTLRLLVLGLFMAYIAWETYRKKLWPAWIVPDKKNTQARVRIICFAGATYTQPSWTNRQHMMSRVSEQYPVLYVEPRRWIVRVIIHHWRNPRELTRFFLRVFFFEKKHDRLYIKAQLNLIPGSREIKTIANLNHWVNRLNILFWAWWLGFKTKPMCVWVYDTEASEYLSAFPESVVLYDCVDDHATQAGMDRNPTRARQEEASIFKRADVVTVTSRRLYELKKDHHTNIHLVLNAGDVKRVLSTQLLKKDSQPDRLWGKIPHPILGTVGALDSYKVDFDMLYEVAERKPQWHFVFIGSPVVDQKHNALDKLRKLPNIHFLGLMPHEQVPEALQNFDVCLIPYRSNPYNEASFPLKFWEFMATGKPVIVTGLPELKHYASLIGYADSTEDFITKIALALNNPQLNSDERKTMALDHSWENRVAMVLKLLNEVLLKKYSV